MKTMDQITMPETTITPEQYAFNARQLVMTILYRAVDDYCFTLSDKKRAEILKDLRSARMSTMSDGMSILVADQLENHHKEIAERLCKYGKDDATEVF